MQRREFCPACHQTILLKVHAWLCSDAAVAERAGDAERAGGAERADGAETASVVAGAQATAAPLESPSAQRLQNPSQMLRQVQCPLCSKALYLKLHAWVKFSYGILQPDYDSSPCSGPGWYPNSSDGDGEEAASSSVELEESRSSRSSDYSVEFVKEPPRKVQKKDS